jgi:hypothetical protein
MEWEMIDEYFHSELKREYPVHVISRHIGKV